MIECHIGNCKHHICNTLGADEGPFCGLDQCVKSTEEMIEMMQERNNDLKIAVAGMFGLMGVLSFLLLWWLA